MWGIACNYSKEFSVAFATCIYGTYIFLCSSINIIMRIRCNKLQSSINRWQMYASLKWLKVHRPLTWNATIHSCRRSVLRCSFGSLTCPWPDLGGSVIVKMDPPKFPRSNKTFHLCSSVNPYMISPTLTIPYPPANCASTVIYRYSTDLLSTHTICDTVPLSQ